MSFWREKIRFRVFHRRMYYDLFCVGVLVLLTVVLLPAWRSLGSQPENGAAEMLATWHLPAALGLLLAVRYGTWDLSLWATMGLGGVVSAGLIRWGVPPWVAVVGGVLPGLGVGGLNALVLSRWRLPGWVVTGLIGSAVVGGVALLLPERGLSVPQDAFDHWVLVVSESVQAISRWLGGTMKPDAHPIGPLVIARMLLAFGVWTAVLLGLMVADLRTADVPRPFARWWVRPASLVICGGLSAFSGVLWVVDHGSAVVPHRPVDGLQIPTAVVLAGAVLLQGRGRTMLAAIFLPMGLLLTSLWAQLVWPMTWWGYSISVLLLLVMTLVAHGGFLWGLDHPRQGRALAWTAAGSAGSALFLVAGSSLVRVQTRQELVLVGLGLWGLGVVLLGLSVVRHRLIYGPDDEADMADFIPDGDFEDDDFDDLEEE